MPTASNTAGSSIATPSELDPPRELAGATTLSATDGAGDLELGRGFGEGKVARAQSRGDVRSEVGPGERLDGAREIAEGDPAIDDQALDLMERVEMTGVRRVAAKAPSGHHRVNRQRTVRHRLFHEVDLRG